MNLTIYIKLGLHHLCHSNVNKIKISFVEINLLQNLKFKNALIIKCEYSELLKFYKAK